MRKRRYIALLAPTNFFSHTIIFWNIYYILAFQANVYFSIFYEDFRVIWHRGLNIRASKDTKSPIIGQIKYGEEVEILHTVGRRGLIEQPCKGWISLYSCIKGKRYLEKAAVTH